MHMKYNYVPSDEIKILDLGWAKLKKKKKKISWGVKNKFLKVYL